MKKLSKSEMKKVKGGWFNEGCGSPCFYFSGGFFQVSTCVPKLPSVGLYPIPLPAVSLPSCVCKATGAFCGYAAVVV
jgi:natural product precursor